MIFTNYRVAVDCTITTLCPLYGAGNAATFSIHIVANTSPANTVVYFETNDVDGLIARLTEKGLVFTTAPAMQSWLWYEAHFSDPAGNKICIYHIGENRLYPPWRIKQ